MRRALPSRLLIAVIASAFLAACAAPTVSERLAAPAPGGAPAVAGKADAQGGATLARSAESVPPDSVGNAQSPDRLIARTTNLSMNVNTVGETIDAITASVTRLGGYVAATSFKNDGERAVGTLSVRVPSRDADDFLREVRRLATRVNEETTSAQDVTDEYTDLGAQLRNLQATESQYLDLMRRAQTVDEILKVQAQLTNVRGQIERIQGRKTYLERRSDMATISLSLRLPPVEAPARPFSGAWDPAGIAQRGWLASLTLLRGVAEVLIVVVAFSWWLVPFIGLGVYFLLHRRRTPAAPAATPVEG
jgi:hypothetical protein